jgi:hypothetical protein
MRDVGLQRGRGVGRRLLAPQRVGEPLGEYHLATREHQQCQDSALARPAEVELLAAVGRRELPQHPDPQLLRAFHTPP